MLVLGASGQGWSVAEIPRTDPWSAAPHSLESLRAAPVALIPYPVHADWSPGGKVVLSPEIPVACGAPDAMRDLESVLGDAGIRIKAGTEDHTPGIRVSIDTAIVTEPEGYRLTVTRTGVDITGHDAAGVFYAVRTLRQMLRTEDGRPTLPCCDIKDAPAFPLRGFMHDTGRNFQTIESLKQQIDRFAAYKLNVFHWHLTDNPAWRPESRVFPRLNDPKFRKEGRDPDGTYSFAQIRDLIRHAKERHVTVIPELDMPGHSACFNRVFGFGMGTPQGMDVLESLIDEFCREIPREDCPYLHLGADEVHVSDPDAFVRRMTARVRSHGRTPVLWNPGLKPVDETTHVQIWGDQSARDTVARLVNPSIDSAGGYLNSYDPLALPQRYFFWQANGQGRGDAAHPGGVLCMWPDIRVDDKENIFRHSPVWPTLLAFSESIWQGRRTPAKELMNRCPRRGSEAWEFLGEFEGRMADHRDRFFRDAPFPWIKQTTIRWQMRDVTRNPDAEWTYIDGTTAQIDGSRLPVGTTLELKTIYQADVERSADFWIGFDFIARSQRESGGVPAPGQWDANGGGIRINGDPVPAPDWKNPGKYRFEEPTWERPPNEIPLTDEELYWCREPVRVRLKPGANVVEMTLHKAYKNQSLQATCAPVRKSGGRWIEDESLRNPDPP